MRFLTAFVSGSLLLCLVLLGYSDPTTISQAANLTAVASTLTPTPLSLAQLPAISASNADRLMPVMRLGNGRIRQEIWSPDRKWLAVCGSIGVWLYQANALDVPPQILGEYTGMIEDVAFSSDSHLLASAGTDNVIRVWELTTGSLLTTFPGSGGVAFSPDNQNIAFVSTDHEVQLWHIGTGILPITFVEADHTMSLISADYDREIYLRGLIFSPDGKMIAAIDQMQTASGLTGLIELWDAATGQRLTVLSEESGLVNDIAFSPDSKSLASVSGTTNEFSSDESFGKIRLWDVATGKPLFALNGKDGPQLSVAFSPDGKRLATADQANAVRLWDTSTGKQVMALYGGTHSLVFSLDGSRLTAGGTSNTIVPWNLGTGQKLTTTTLKGFTNRVASVAFSPDGSQLVAGGYDANIRLWNIQTGTVAAETSASLRDDDSVRSVAFSSNGRQVAFSTFSGAVSLWDIKAKQVRVILPAYIDSLYGVAVAVNSVAFSPDGKFLATAGDVNHDSSIVVLWDVATGKPVTKFEGSYDTTGLVRSVAFSRDGHYLVAASEKALRLWDISTGKNILTLNHEATFATAASVTADDKQLIFEDFGSINVWDVATNNKVITMDAYSIGSDDSANVEVRSLAVSRDETLVVGGTHQAPVGASAMQFWNSHTGKSLALRHVHTAEIHSLAFSPDGTRLASGSDDGTILIWGAS